MNRSRRAFLAASGLSAIAAGSSLILPDYARATEPSGKEDDHVKQLLASLPKSPAGGWQATDEDIEGPYYRQGALFRAKVTPPMEPGRLLVVSGRVWGLDTRKPLSMAVLDVWQANDKGRYDNDDPAKPPRSDFFANRARMVTDEAGRYEFETIHPGRYKNGATYRPEHIHFLVTHPGYTSLITQLYFDGDPYNKTDPFIKPSLTMKVSKAVAHGANYDTVTFDIVLAKI